MKKYKAIICDDDQIILTGLRKLIPWDEIGIDLCGCGNNGREAKDLFDKYLPEILVSDIKMPFLSGMELTRYVKEQKPETKVIIISGYDDFQYAQAAVRAGAIDYILKPIDETNMIQQLRKAVAECKKDETLKVIRKEYQAFLEEKMIQSLIFEDLTTYVQKYGSRQLENSELQYCSVVLMKLNTTPHASELRESELSEVNAEFDACLQHITNMNVGVFEKRPGSAGIYIVTQYRDQHERVRDEAIAAMKKSFSPLCKTHAVIFACSNIGSRLPQIKLAYHEARLAMKEHFANPSADVLNYCDLNLRDKDREIKRLMSALTELDFVSIIKQGDKDKIEKQLNSLRDTMLATGGNSDVFMKMMVANLYARLLKEIRQLGLEQEGFKVDPIEEYQKTAECKNVDEGIYELRKSMYAIIDFLDENRSSRNSKLIAKALEYIDKHYMQHEFSIEDVAQFVHISPSYFSVIFKAEQGIAFTDFLIKMRMKQAKNLMQNTDMPIYEISYMVGYDTAAYFSSAFKKHTGVSPSVYKKNLKSN